MDNLLFRFDSATDLELDQNVPKYSALYKNSDKLIKKQQQRRNEILSNRSSKKEKLIASIRRLVSEVVGEDDGNNSANDYNANISANTSSSSSDHLRNQPFKNGRHQTDTSEASCMDGLSSRLINQATTEGLNRLDDDCSDSGMLAERSDYASNVDNRINEAKSRANSDRKFRNKAMLSEWLVDRPMDFESEWLLKPTPVGRRCLVFARKGETVAYSRTGQFIKAFQSSLPGGNRHHTSQCRRQFAIVDCIYIQHKNAFYLMDALAWNEHNLYESEASFRFFWLQSRYNENRDKFTTTNARNESRFFCLNTYSVTDQNILLALRNDSIIKEHNLFLDGLLFFHSQGPYVPGANPLVLWIKPDMVNRVLNSP